MIQLFLILCGLASIIYLLAVFFLFAGLIRKQPPGAPHDLTFSVIIAAHNEERVIENCLQHVLAQNIDAGRYEVILAADRCTDATVEIAQRFYKAEKKFSILEINDVAGGLSPKKNALAKAIAQTRNEIIVITDADCTVPPTWLETIDRYFDKSTGCVQGITSYTPITGINKFLYNIQSVDFISHGIISAAAIRSGLPINANANNLAVRQNAFVDAGGYSGIGGIISGDDDLLLQRIYRLGTYKIRYMTDAAGAVTTLPSPTWSALFEQRKRWGSKTVHYNKRQVALLSSIFAFYCLTAICFIAGFANTEFFIIFFSMLAVKLIGENMLMIPGTQIFRQTHLRRHILLGSLLQLPMVIVAVFLGVFGKFKWKETVFRRISPQERRQTL